VTRTGDLVVCDWSGHQVVKLSSKDLKVIGTLLTLDRDGIESPRHVRYVPENGMMLVSWLNFLDVYSFTQSATQGYLASSERYIRNQRIREANELHKEISQSSANEQAIMASELSSIFKQLPSHQDESEMTDKSTVGKHCTFPHIIIAQKFNDEVCYYYHHIEKMSMYIMWYVYPQMKTKSII